MLDPAATSRVTERLRAGDHKPDPVAALTEQERRILLLIGEGLTNRQIGERLHLAERAIKNYVSSLRAKLGMQRRVQAAVYATHLEQDKPGGPDRR